MEKLLTEFINNDNPVTKIVLAWSSQSKKGGRVTHKNRPSHGLVLIEDGETTYKFSDGTTLNCKQSDLIYLPKNSTYEVTSKVAPTTWCINFQCANDACFKPCIMHLSNASEVLKEFQVAEKTWQRVKDGRELQVYSSLYKILYEIRRLSASNYLPKTKQNLIKPAVDYIHKHYLTEQINVEDLAKLCLISTNYLRKLFLAFYGVSPIKYINDLKIKRAKELLSSGMYSVSETALNSGFTDLSHFSRFFKQSVGVLPSEYVENNF